MEPRDRETNLVSAPCGGRVGEWYVLHVRSRQEKALCQDLRLRRIAHYLPVIPQHRAHGRRRAQMVELPLFPGYVFLKGSMEEAYLADRTGRVARIIVVPDQKQLDGELTNVCLALSSGRALDAHPYLREGVRVRVSQGPLQGLEGMITSRYKRDRLIVQVDVLGQAVSMEIGGTSLELL
jgi:transcription antitermination factor NusG